MATSDTLAKSTPVRKTKLSDAVLDRLLKRIKNGEYPTGSFLPSERRLMETFEVGRPAVREALQDLHRMGLVVISHGERARVVAPTARSLLDQIQTTAQHIISASPQNLDHLKEARQFFEIGVVRIAASQATPDQVVHLRELIVAHEAVGDDVDAFLAADLAFHKALADIVGNPIFTAVSEAMLEWLREYHTGLVKKVGRESKTLTEHRQIVDQIARHDVEGAAAAMLAHLTRAQDLYETPGRTAT